MNKYFGIISLIWLVASILAFVVITNFYSVVLYVLSLSIFYVLGVLGKDNKDK